MAYDRAAARRRLIDRLQRSNLIQKAGDPPTTIYGEPAWRAVAPGREPEPLMAGSTRQRDLVASAHGTPTTGEDLCAAWVEAVFSRLGLGIVVGNARELYERWCRDADTRALKVGMIVAVPAHPYSAAGLAWGHVGLYVGDGMVMDCADARVRTAPLEAWTSAYGVMAEPRWGWLGGIALD